MIFIGTGLVVATIDPAWAIPVNSFLLLLMALLQLTGNRQQKRDHVEVKQVTERAAGAAEVAASNAEQAVVKAGEAVEVTNAAHAEILSAVKEGLGA